MKQATYTIEFVTPCFCAGADQSKAEVRAPAVRGQLRWWFRALGGSAAEERAVFGGIAGAATASGLIIRTLKLTDGPKWEPPRVDPNATDSYVWYFASVSGKEPKQKGIGPRWQSSAAIAPGSRYRLEIIQRIRLADLTQTKLDQTIDCFLSLGSLGLRITRGLGAFTCLERPLDIQQLDRLQRTLSAAGFRLEHYSDQPLYDVASIAKRIGSLVKGTRRAQNMKADRPSPFGSSQPRQTSAILFRPFRRATTNHCELMVMEAPHSRILGPSSRQPLPIVGRTPSELTRFEPVSNARNHR